MTDKIVAYPSENCNANQKQYQQLSLLLYRPHKPQIVSVPGLSHKERDRYRVVIGEEILGDRLTIEGAIELVKQGGEA